MHFLDKLEAQGHFPAASTPAVPAGTVVPLRTVGSSSDTAYGLAALTGICDDIQAAGVLGGRDVAFNRACLRAGDLIRDGDLTRATAETALRAAGGSVSDPADFTTYKIEEKIARVIDQGIASDYTIRRGQLDAIPELRPYYPPSAPPETPAGDVGVLDGTDWIDPGTGDVIGTSVPDEQPHVDPMHTLRVQAALIDLRVKHEALLLHRAELAARHFREPPSRSTLTDELLLPDPPVEYAIAELLPVGGNALLAAQYKTGKTTTVNGLAKAFADGTPFLGRYGVNPAGGRIALWNYELSDSQYRRWLREVGIINTDAVCVLHLRGYRLPITSPQVEDWIVRWLVEHDVTFWVPDPFARAAVGTDENSNTDVGVWLDTLDVIKQRAGVRDLVLPTHTGRAEQEAGQERARGATRLDDWADVRWLLTKDADDNRFFRATGRDVEVEEQLLTYDEASRLQTIGGGDRRWVAGRAREQTILDYVVVNPGCTTTDVECSGGNKKANVETLRGLVARHKVRAEDVKTGRARAVRHYANEVTA